MSYIEIERKFLVDPQKLPTIWNATVDISQGYLSVDPERTVRVRTTANTLAFITVKGKSSDNGLSRFEWEKPISIEEGNLLIDLCDMKIIKSRSILRIGNHKWEIDKFSGDNGGLVIAEIELKKEDELFVIPEWVTNEVTGDPRYYNSNLMMNPYKNWRK